MQKKYILKNAITLNATGEKFDAVAIQVNAAEIRKHNHQFEYFDFIRLISDGYVIYKICRQEEENIFQGLVAVRPSTEFLDCANMETNNFNKRPISLYGNIAKCIVSLCCKISTDTGFGGYIAFYAKNELFGYYERLGAKRLFGLRMYIDEKTAHKLIDLYF